MLTLFAAKNTVAVAAHIALEETGLTYDINWISFADGDQRKPDYLAINPKGRVPALVSDGTVITETPAILEFIAETSGTLMPKDLPQRARVREIMAYCASTFHVNHAHKLRGIRWSDDPAAHATMQEKVPQTMSDSCAFLDQQLSTDWVADAYSIADIHVYAICRWLDADSVNIGDFPRLAAHFNTIRNRPAVAKVEQAHA